MSSVIRGFAEERAAAKEAIELLSHQAVMAEAFGARPHSAQEACLTEVAKSEVLLAVLGERYGYTAPSGKSVCEEELEEAERRGLPVLVLISTRTLDADQQRFADRLRDYENGYFVASYEDLAGIKDGVIKALNGLVASHSVEPMSANEADQLLARVARESPLAEAADPYLSAVIAPARHSDEECFPGSLLDSGDFIDHIKKELLFGGAPRLFDDRLGCVRSDNSDWVQIGQGPLLDGQRNEQRSTNSAAVRIYTDGAISLACQLKNRRADRFDFGANTVVDRGLFQDRVAGFLRLAESVFDKAPGNRPLAGFYVRVALERLGDKLFGELERHSSESFSFNLCQTPGAVLAYRSPRRISRVDLRESVATATEMVDRIARVLRVSGAYYPQDDTAAEGRPVLPRSRNVRG